MVMEQQKNFLKSKVEFEKSIAQINQRLSGIETLFLLTAADLSYISSSIVREIINHKGDFSSLVPSAVKK